MKHHIIPQYYTEVTDQSSTSIFKIWEDGGYVNDSITPAVHVPTYRQHILRQIIGHTPPDMGVLSLGCGNGFVESMLVRRGYDVAGIDLHKDAVELSCKKGIRARQFDFYDLTPSDLDDVGCIYADGFIGHLYTEAEGIGPFVQQLKTLANGRRLNCVISNDAPSDPEVSVEPHQAVPNFWYVSIDFLLNEFHKSGFENISSQNFLYQRPKSGDRIRSILTFRI